MSSIRRRAIRLAVALLVVVSSACAGRGGVWHRTPTGAPGLVALLPKSADALLLLDWQRLRRNQMLIQMLELIILRFQPVKSFLANAKLDLAKVDRVAATFRFGPRRRKSSLPLLVLVEGRFDKEALASALPVDLGFRAGPVPGVFVRGRYAVGLVRADVLAFGGRAVVEEAAALASAGGALPAGDGALHGALEAEVGTAASVRGIVRVPAELRREEKPDAMSLPAMLAFSLEESGARVDLAASAEFSAPEAAKIVAGAIEQWRRKLRANAREALGLGQEREAMLYGLLDSIRVAERGSTLRIAASLQAVSGSGLVAAIELATAMALPSFSRYLKSTKALRRR